MKKLTLLSSVCTVAIVSMSCRPCGSCKRAPAEAKPSAEKALTIAMIPKSMGGEFWETVERGALRAAVDLGVTLKFEGTLTETELAGQNKIVENMVNLGVD